MKNITMIAAVGKNLELGKDNDLIWHFKEDMKFFKENTINKPIVMGMKTLESLPHLLPKRTHIVLTRQNKKLDNGIIIVHSVDEFAREARYYDYIKEQKVIQRDITFMTKAEDKNMAVACGSIISRYIFLKEFDKLCDSIHIPLPKGAGKDVDSIGEEVVEKYGEEKLKDIAKLNFKNTERILHTMIY